MIGTYRFYQDGVLIRETNNLITAAGKIHIIKYLAGYVGSIAEGIAVGSGSTAAVVGDTSLAFEWSRQPIDVISTDQINTAIIFKGEIPAESSGKIYEVGLWSAVTPGKEYDSRLILDFDSAIDIWSTGTWEVTTNRIGANNLRLNPALSTTQTASLAALSLDLSGYSALDEFRLAYNVNSAFVATAKLILYTDASNYFTYTITTPTAGYKITPFTKANFVVTGAPTWNNITSIDVQVTSTAGGSGSVDFDGLRIEDKSSNPEEYVLVSRAVLGAPITKAIGAPLEFEYSLDVTL